MKRQAGIVLVVLLLGIVGCGERKAQVAAPKSYQNAGVSFDYPSNWTVSSDVDQGPMRYLIVESPGNAMAVVQIYPAEDALPLDEFARQFARIAKEETPFGKISSSSFGEVTEADGDEQLHEEFAITVAGQRLDHVRDYRRKAAGEKVCYLITQIASEDEALVEKGFDLFNSSFEYEAP